MKTRIFTICIMVAALAMFAPVANADFKAIGVGWIPILVYDDDGIQIDEEKATFALHMKYDDSKDELTGKMQFIDHYNNINAQGEVADYTYEDGHLNVQGIYWTQPKGNDDELSTFVLDVSEREDEDNFYIDIRFTGGDFGDYRYSGFLGGGNINIKVK